MKVNYNILRGKFINQLDGTINTGYIEVKQQKEFITSYIVENNAIQIKLNIKAQKVRGEGYDTVEKAIYTVYKLHYQEISNMNKLQVVAQRTVETYKFDKKYSRVNGPCVIDSGVSKEDSLFYCKPIELWGYMGEVISEWCPRICEKERIGNWSNANLLKTALHFDRDYSVILLKHQNQSLLML